MATARHPQSLLCDEMHGRPLTREHGAPLRLVLPTTLGYKQAKYIVGLRVTKVLGAKRGYWVDQGDSRSPQRPTIRCRNSPTQSRCC